MQTGLAADFAQCYQCDPRTPSLLHFSLVVRSPVYPGLEYFILTFKLIFVIVFKNSHVVAIFSRLRSLSTFERIHLVLRLLLQGPLAHSLFCTLYFVKWILLLDEVQKSAVVVSSLAIELEQFVLYRTVHQWPALRRPSNCVHPRYKINNDTTAHTLIGLSHRHPICSTACAIDTYCSKEFTLSTRQEAHNLNSQSQPQGGLGPCTSIETLALQHSFQLRLSSSDQNIYRLPLQH